MTGFDPANWIVLPGGSAVHRSDLGPCRCGNRRFAVTRKAVDDGPAVIRVVCLECVDRRAVGVAIGTLDMDSGRFTTIGRAG